MARHIPPRRVPRDRFVFSQGSGSAGGIFGGASIPGAHTHLEVDITDLDKFSQAAADARFAAIVHTHLEADITDLQNYSLVGHTHIFANLTDSIANGQVPVGAVTQHQAALAIAFSQITGTVDADLLDGLDSTAFAPVSHTHLEADITDLKAYLELAGGTMTGDLTLTKTQPGIRMNALGTSNSFIAWQDDGSSKFIMGWKNSETSFKLNIGSSLAARSDFVMDAAGLVTFGTTPEVSGTAVSLVGHTHLEADITDLGDYLLKSGGTLTGTVLSSINLGFRIQAPGPEYILEETDGPIDENIWGWRADAGIMAFRVINDAFTVGVNFLTVLRTGTVVDTITLNAPKTRLNILANATTILEVGESLTLRGSSQVGAIQLFGETAGAISGMIVQHIGSNLQFIANVGDTDIQFKPTLKVEIIAGKAFRIRDATNFDSGAWQHDGTDFNLLLTNTTDYNITGANLKLGSGLGVNGATPVTTQTVTGSRGGNAALASLLTAMANYGLITDSTT